MLRLSTVKDIIATKIRLSFDGENFQKKLRGDGLKPKISHTGEGDAGKSAVLIGTGKQDSVFDMLEGKRIFASRSCRNKN